MSHVCFWAVAQPIKGIDVWILKPNVCMSPGMLFLLKTPSRFAHNNPSSLHLPTHPCLPHLWPISLFFLPLSSVQDPSSSPTNSSHSHTSNPNSSPRHSRNSSSTSTHYSSPNPNSSSTCTYIPPRPPLIHPRSPIITRSQSNSSRPHIPTDGTVPYPS